MARARTQGRSAAKKAAARKTWRALTAGSLVALLIAVVLLSGAAQGIVGTVSALMLLLGFSQMLDDPDYRRRERQSPSTYTDVYGGGGYHTATGEARAQKAPVGPVNSPAQHSIDDLERTWRSSGGDE